MEINIFDVELGNSALVVTPTGTTTLLDCGHSSETGFRPSLYLKHRLGINGVSRRLDRLVLSHADQDHISDLLHVTELDPYMLVRNPSLLPEKIRRIKLETANYIEPEVEKYIDLHERYTGPVPVMNEGGVEFSHFFNPSEAFEDLNDLSLVTFVTLGKFSILFPGDLSSAGWRELLKDPMFLEKLSGVTILVASHHGRYDGYCEEIFNYFQPQAVIYSDKGMVHDSQYTQNLYAQHTTGTSFWTGSNMEDRKIITTRCDGPLSIATDGQIYTLQSLKEATLPQYCKKPLFVGGRI